MYLIGFVAGWIILKKFCHSLNIKFLEKSVILSRYTHSHEFNDMISKDYVTNGEIDRFLRDIRNLISFKKRTRYCAKVQIVYHTDRIQRK